MNGRAPIGITGIGRSNIGRRLGKPAILLAVQAALAAVESAGITVEEVDGIAVNTAGVDHPRGFSGVGVSDLQAAMGLSLRWYAGGPELPGQLGSVIEAASAAKAGLADNILCIRAVTEASAQGMGGRAAVMPGGGPHEPGSALPRVGSSAQWVAPFGAPSPANWIAWFAQAHFNAFGTKREHLGAFAINCRRNASLNDAAIYREPFGMEEYLGSRLISEPLCLLDCDVPVDGAIAFVVSTGRSRAWREEGGDRPALIIESVGAAVKGKPSWHQWEDLTEMAMFGAARDMWARSDLGPKDIDIAQVYDGFSFIALAWLEALGFCPKGESGPFVEGGTRIALEGTLPVNTDGGQLSAGRMHGYGHLYEACIQMWGQAEQRQVSRSGVVEAGASGLSCGSMDKARMPQTAVVASGGGPLAGCLTLVSSGS